MVNRSALREWCGLGELPEGEKFYAALLEDTGKFTDIEGQYWDFKNEWPFSYSNGYFGAICRLICAFSNSTGGFIVFGVDDKTRIGGKNKVRPNLDKMSLAFEQLTGKKLEYDFKTYTNDAVGDVDVLLIKPRPRSTTPITFQRKIEQYADGIVWVRSENEVVRAQPQHYARLFCSLDADAGDESIEGSIPPSTSQIRKFIGRAEAMSKLFDWLQNSDEPRTYLYGKGGSGKTMIAREFSKLVKNFGKTILIEGNNHIDTVIFLSAKEKELSSSDAKIVDLDFPDFFDEITLLQRIISLSGGSADIDSLEAANLTHCRKIVSEYLNAFSYLIVIDDIDTLTTKGVDPGADFLYRTLSRSSKRSKVLYTTRSAPSQSIHNSILVPGLTGEEYEQFVNECILKFGAPKPSVEFRDTRLKALSEGRPLVIESIIALARTSGGYDNAERLFSQNVGEEIRDYVFRREWDALPNGLERPLLAALSDLNRPSSFLDLTIVLQAGESTIRDALSSVREMFLTVDDAGSATLFSLAPLTRSFVNSRKASLKLYPVVRERTASFKKTVKTSPPESIRVVSQIRRFLPLRFRYHSAANKVAALTLVRDGALSVKVTEDPAFRSARGYVEAIQDRPNIALVRESFGYALQMSYEPEIEELMAWFEAEKASSLLSEYPFKITEVVISGRRYSEEDKIGMISRRGTTYYHMAKQFSHSDPDLSLRYFQDSVGLHLRAFKLNALSGSPMMELSERYARSTSDQWFDLLFRSNKWLVVSGFIDIERQCDGYLDPLFDPLINHLRRIVRTGLFAVERPRIQAEAKRALGAPFDRKKWMDTTLLPQVQAALSEVLEAAKVVRKN